MDYSIEVNEFMNESSPKVSVVLPTFNGEKYIRQSIDSCLNQTHCNIELIIVDDGSTDETPEIIKSYKDERIKYLRHEKNKGLPNALNTGFAKADGEYLTWTSDDNYYVKDAIEKMLCFLQSKNCSFVYCNFYIFNDKNPYSLNIVRLPDKLALENLNGVGACFLYSSKVKEAIGDYDPETFLAEDYDYWIRTSKKFHMEHFEEPLYFFREHAKSLTKSRFYEVRIVDILVRLKNEVLLDIDKAVDSLINTIAGKHNDFFRINKVIAEIRYSRKIKRVLKDFKIGKLNFKEAKSALGDIILK